MGLGLKEAESQVRIARYWMKGGKSSNKHWPIQDAIVKGSQVSQSSGVRQPGTQTRLYRLKHDYLCCSLLGVSHGFEQRRLTLRGHLLDPKSWWRTYELRCHLHLKMTWRPRPEGRPGVCIATWNVDPSIKSLKFDSRVCPQCLVRPLPTRFKGSLAMLTFSKC